MGDSVHLFAEETPRKTFPFFSFPRELRDAVHVKLANDFQLVTENAILQPISLFVENGLATNILLISRQFSEEYRECFEKSSRLVARDTGEHYTTAADVVIPVGAVSIQQLEVHLFAGSGWPHRELRDHLHWIPPVLDRLKQLQRLRINIYFQRSQGEGEQSLEEVMKHGKTAWELGRVCALRKASAVCLFSCDKEVEGCLGIEDTFGKGTFAFGSWDPFSGWKRLCEESL